MLRTLLTLRPTEVVALTTAASAPTVQRLRAVHQELAQDPGLAIREVCVPALDLPELNGMSARVLAEGPASVCYAGGTPAMSAALMRQFLERADECATAWYVADDGDVLLGHRGEVRDTRPEMAAAPLTLRQMMLLHGTLPPNWREPGPIEPPTSLRAEYLRLQSMPRSVAGPDAAEACRSLITAVLSALAGIVGSAGSVYPESRVVVKGRSGERTETLPPCIITGGRLTSLSIPAYTRSARRTGSKPFDRSTALGSLKEGLYAVAFLAQLAGGVHARALSIATDPSGDGGAERLLQDLGPMTLPDLIDPADPARRISPSGRLGSFSFQDLLIGLSNRVFDVGLRTPITSWLLGGGA